MADCLSRCYVREDEETRAANYLNKMYPECYMWAYPHRKDRTVAQERRRVVWSWVCIELLGFMFVSVNGFLVFACL